MHDAGLDADELHLAAALCDVLPYPIHRLFCQDLGLHPQDRPVPLERRPHYDQVLARLQRGDQVLAVSEALEEVLSF